MRSIKWLLIYLVVSFVWWFGSAILELQGAMDSNIRRTRGFLSWLANLDVLPDGLQQKTAQYLSELPLKIVVDAVDVDDMGVLRYWLVWIVSVMVVYGAVFLVVHLPPASWIYQGFMSGVGNTTYAPASSTDGGQDKGWVPVLWVVALVVLIALPFVL